MSNKRKASDMSLRFVWMSACGIHKNRDPECRICKRGWWEDSGKDVPDVKRA